MAEALRQPVMQQTGTISPEKLDSLHTIEELDASLQRNIQEGRLIDSDWRTLPMRAWDEVYESLCHEVGAAYGLNDIREA